MENLSKIEKSIIEYLVKSDKYSDDSISEIGSYEFPGSNIETIIYVLLEQDKLLKNAGIKISFDKNENQIQMFVMELLKVDNKDSEIKVVGNWTHYTKINYLIVRITSFLRQLENNGYVDSVEIRKGLIENNGFLPMEFHCEENYTETFKISNTEIISDFLDCFKYIYVPNNKLRSFYKNGYKSLALTIAEKDTLLAKQNNKIANYALYTSVFSAIASLIATIITLYSIGIPATIKIDKTQVEKILEKIEKKEKSVIKIDSLKSKNTKHNNIYK